MISVKRVRDGKVFTSDMSGKNCIIEMHFCTSYTQVIVQEETMGSFLSSDVICEPLGTVPNFADLIAVAGDDVGELMFSGVVQ